MSTEVKHGPAPMFASEVTPGTFSITIVGHYTATPGLAAAGVTDVKWESNRPEKQHAELLALRTAFLEWFVEQARLRGDTFADATRRITEYPFR